MGDIAEDILDGIFDEITGEYLGEGVGYPRSIHQKNKYKPQTNNPSAGVGNYLCQYTKRGKRAIVSLYCNTIIEFNYIQHGYDNACVEIQKNFTRFAQFVSKNRNQFYTFKQ